MPEGVLTSWCPPACDRGDGLRSQPITPERSPRVWRKTPMNAARIAHAVDTAAPLQRPPGQSRLERQRRVRVDHTLPPTLRGLPTICQAAGGPAGWSRSRPQHPSLQEGGRTDEEAEAIALHWESYSLSCSNTIRTARSRTSGEYLLGLPMMTPILSSNGVSGKPGAVQRACWGNLPSTRTKATW